MRQTPEEKALLDAALVALITTLPAQVVVKLVREQGPAVLRVGTQAIFGLVVRPGWRGQVGNLQLASEGQQVLVVPYVGEAQGAQLRARGICYLDRVGNAWLTDTTGTLAVLVQGRARPAVTPAAVGGLVLGKPGLLLVHVLLLEPELVRASYRAVAARVGLPVATVGRAMLALQGQGFVRGETSRWLARPGELRRRWIDAYGETLRPKLAAGRYRWLEPARARWGWQEVALPAGTRWGGEPAAHLLLDGYLLPEYFTLYSTARRGELMGALRLVPDPQGKVEVLVPFDESEMGVVRPGCVSPLLAYADLVLSGDARNMEVAQMLAKEYLKSY